MKFSKAYNANSKRYSLYAVNTGNFRTRVESELEILDILCALANTGNFRARAESKLETLSFVHRSPSNWPCLTGTLMEETISEGGAIAANERYVDTVISPTVDG
jgi:hypothetical protein